MKKLFSLIALTAALLMFIPPQKTQGQTLTVITSVQSQGDFSGVLSTLDTLTNVDTTTYILSVRGPKHCVTFQTDVLKISGTVASTVKIYGSIDGGTSYITAPVTTLTITDATANYGVSYSVNGYDTYKIQLITAGTQRFSQRTYALWRKSP